MAKSLDELLWTFRQGSFVPHELLTPGRRASTAPVTIGSADADGAGRAARRGPADQSRRPRCPAFFNRYPRIAEIIDGSPAGREAGRARHRFYRDQGLEPETHEVT